MRRMSTSLWTVETKLFTRVVVPTEVPSKTDFGDVDFLAESPKANLKLAQTPFPYDAMVRHIKEAFKTEYGKRGFKTPSVLYFAVPAPGREREFFV
ncbi:hypothetical protein EJ04DRAFT_561502 [Polyplosphaeria fusca]|uniref:Uncharacterized protein n=1 Tax=Polyplosphaeria fusca TaxID=682080 RepID=A0A9P4R2Q3_9PLEO|nr:hypothetical protein EJ04DRAFT_561502 [Polyplosphaeria fusca]